MAGFGGRSSRVRTSQVLHFLRLTLFSLLSLRTKTVALPEASGCCGSERPPHFRRFLQRPSRLHETLLGASGHRSRLGT